MIKFSLGIHIDSPKVDTVFIVSWTESKVAWKEQILQTTWPVHICEEFP